jgi:prevent-host-death family protein
MHYDASIPLDSDGQLTPLCGSLSCAGKFHGNHVRRHTGIMAERRITQYLLLILSLYGDNIKTIKETIMPIIKPISSLRNKTREIASLCHDQDEPVYLTTNGEGDLVVMSIEHFEKLNARLDLLEKLAVAQSQASSGEKGITHSQMMQKLRQRSHAR